MFEKLEECPSCGHPKFINHLICIDHSISGDSFALVKCNKCELVFTNPRPSIDTIGDYYESDNYISHSNKSLSPIDFIYKLVRKITLHQKLEIIESLNNKDKSLLDYGCGTGHFLGYMKSNGWAVNGVEPNQKARNMAIRKTGASVEEDISKSNKLYNIITAWHVLEHVHDLDSTLKGLRKKLTKTGHLIIAVPNPNSLDAHHYKQDWAAYDVPRHLYHFTQSSFERLVSNRKLKIKQTIPMKFDAYYVSLLSEKYSTGSRNFVQAIKIGYRSNKKASQTGEYSSLIYILTQ